MTVFDKKFLSIKTWKTKENFADNQFHNILRLFDVLPNFPFTTSETMGDCPFSYAGNWELVKSIVGTKLKRGHVCLHSQVGNRL